MTWISDSKNYDSVIHAVIKRTLLYVRTLSKKSGQILDYLANFKKCLKCGFLKISDGKSCIAFALSTYILSNILFRHSQNIPPFLKSAVGLPVKLLDHHLENSIIKYLRVFLNLNLLFSDTFTKSFLFVN